MKKSLLTKIIGTILGVVFFILSASYIAYLIMNSDSAFISYTDILMITFRIVGKILLVTVPIVVGIMIFKYTYD